MSPSRRPPLPLSPGPRSPWPSPPALTLALVLAAQGCWSGGGIGASSAGQAPAATAADTGVSPAAASAGGTRSGDVQEVGGAPTGEATTPPPASTGDATTTPSTPATPAPSTPAPSTPTPTTPTVPPATAPAAPPLPNPIPGLTVIGRAELTDPLGPRFAFCNSRIGIRFSGPTLTVRLKGTGQDRWLVTVDGKDAARPVIATVPNQALSYTLAERLAEGPHTAWLTKLTEFSQGSPTDAGVTQFLGFGLPDGGEVLSPPEARTRRLDFVGDSGFTGYGVGQLVTWDQNPTTGNDCGYTPATQNAVTSIPQFTADTLGAELMNLSWSGKSISHSIYDPNPARMLPVVYDEILPPSASPQWDFTQWIADAVIINGGGNDVFNAYQPGKEYFYDPAQFTSNYLGWIKRIRSRYPKALVVVVLTHAAFGSNAEFLGKALKDVVAQANQAGDAQVVYFSYFDGDPTYHTYDDLARQKKFYWGCNKHPSPSGARFLAQRLAEFLEPRLAQMEAQRTRTASP